MRSAQMPRMSIRGHNIQKGTQPMQHLGRTWIVCILTGATVLLAACGGNSSGTNPGKPLTIVKLALDFTPNTNHTGIFVALAKGWYREQGIDLQFVPAGATYPEALVGSGQADFGISFQEYTAASRVQGQPIVSIAAIVQHNTSVMAVLKSSGITRPAQLAGKRLASFQDPAEQAIIAVMQVNDGVTAPGYQTIAFQNPDIKNLQTGSADFIWTYLGIEVIQARNAGIDLTTFLLQDYGVPDFYSPDLITSEQTIKQHPDLVKGFLAATAKGYTFAAQHVAESAKLLDSGARSQGGTLYGSARDLTDSQTYMSPQYAADVKCWGTQSAKVWTDFTRFLYRNGVLLDANNKPLGQEPDYNAMFTNQFLPACP